MWPFRSDAIATGASGVRVFSLRPATRRRRRRRHSLRPAGDERWRRGDRDLKKKRPHDAAANAAAAAAERSRTGAAPLRERLLIARLCARPFRHRRRRRRQPSTEFASIARRLWSHFFFLVPSAALRDAEPAAGASLGSSSSSSSSHSSRSSHSSSSSSSSSFGSSFAFLDAHTHTHTHTFLFSGVERPLAGKKPDCVSRRILCVAVAVVF